MSRYIISSILFFLVIIFFSFVFFKYLSEENIKKIPLFFPQKRVRFLDGDTKPYFVIIGQERHEKGYHLILKENWI